MYRLLSAAVAAGAAAALAAGPAAAATSTATWTVTPGGGFTAPAFAAALSSSTTHFDCAGVTMTGTFKAGSGLANPIGQITTMTRAGGPIICRVPGTAFQMTFTHSPMSIRAVRYHSASGLTTGMVTGIHITLSTSPGATRCTGTIDGTGPVANDGTVPFTYSNSGGRFTFASNGTGLKAYNITGCNGRIHSGDVSGYNGLAFPRTTAGTANRITSP